MFVYVPSFSANVAEGSTTSANSLTSLGKVSCTRRKSSPFSASTNSPRSPLVNEGLSPIIWSALIRLLRIASASSRMPTPGSP